tara:strand:- start:1513 stop:2109 length:597 start_codon:yes stop_codon:yes gene_type:complete
MKGIVLFACLILTCFGQQGHAKEKVQIINMKPSAPSEWREYLDFRREEVLSTLYSLKPEARGVIARAKGYAVFTNFGMKILFFGSGNGRGILRNAKTGKDTYMRMFQAGVGLGMGMKDFRMVFVFENSKVLKNFAKGGWKFGTDADLAIKAEDSGAATSGSIRVAPGLRVYQLTENGLALNAMVNGTKYWIDSHVNKK